MFHSYASGEQDLNLRPSGYEARRAARLLHPAPASRALYERDSSTARVVNEILQRSQSRLTGRHLGRAPESASPPLQRRNFPSCGSDIERLGNQQSHAGQYSSPVRTPDCPRVDRARRRDHYQAARSVTAATKIILSFSAGVSGPRRPGGSYHGRNQPFSGGRENATHLPSQQCSRDECTRPKLNRNEH